MNLGKKNRPNKGNRPLWLALGMEKGKQDLPEPCAPVGCCPFAPSVHSSLYSDNGRTASLLHPLLRKFSLRSHLSVFYICLLYITAATQPLVSLLNSFLTCSSQTTKFALNPYLYFVVSIIMLWIPLIRQTSDFLPHKGRQPHLDFSLRLLTQNFIMHKGLGIAHMSQSSL